MEIKYHFEYIEKSIEFVLEPNDEVSGYIHNIGGWLHSDVQCWGEDYISKIKNVLEGKVEEEFFWGNAYKTLVHKDYTKITYSYEEDNPKMVPCTLPTEMLYEILQIWTKAREEHYKNKD